MGGFGISRVLTNTNEKAKTQVGTPYYLSPEICLDKAYDQKSDIWSLGCVLCELTTLTHAFDAANMHALRLNIMRGKYNPPPAIFSAELRGLIADMLNRDPSKRPNINEVLRRPVLQNRIRQFLSESVRKPISAAKEVQEIIDATQALLNLHVEEKANRTENWRILLKSTGVERHHALQAVVDGWQSQRWVLAQEELGRGSSGVVFRSTDSITPGILCTTTHAEL